jgi:CRP/FNR family transcriptional regulator
MIPYLLNHRPFSSLPTEVLDAIADQVQELIVPAEHVFFTEGAREDAVYVTREGRVRIQHLRPDGSARTVCLVGPGDTFCCLPALDGGPYPATATSTGPATVYRLPGDLFRSLVEQHPAFARIALQQFCGRLREWSCEGCAQADDVGSRLAGRLLALSVHMGDEVKVTRKELAEMVGTTVETAIRATREFEDRGWLELGRGRLRILDRLALTARARGERATS